MSDPTTPPAPVRAALYCRISKDRTGEGLGVERQRADCLELATSLAWTPVEIYTDNDTSATSGRARPGYRKMLTDIQAGHANAIITWHPDRLYRRGVDLEELIPIVEEHDVAIATVRAGDFDLATPTGRMIARIIGAVATGEVEHKTDRWARSWRQHRERGDHLSTGSRLFGYTRDGQLVPAEATIARRMAADVIAGIPLLTIARRLEQEGVTATRGGAWRTGTIRQYLTNPRIAGYSTMGREIVGEGTWPHVLDRDTWETVRAILTSRARDYVPRKSLLNGLIFCGGTHPDGTPCGHRLITSGQRGKRTYRCPNRPGMPGCGGVSGNAEPIEAIVEAYAQTRLTDPRVREYLERMAAQDSPKVLTEIALLEARLRELEAQLDEPGTPVAMLMRAYDRTRTKLEDAQRRLTATTPAVIPAVDGAWPDPEDLVRRRRLVDLVVERVALSPASRRVRPFDVERVTITRRTLD